MSMSHQANRAPGMPLPLGYHVSGTQPRRVSIVNRHESRTPIHHGLAGRLVSQYSDTLLKCVTARAITGQRSTWSQSDFANKLKRQSEHSWLGIEDSNLGYLIQSQGSKIRGR